MAHVMRLVDNVIPASHGFEPDEVLRAADRWKRLSLFAGTHDGAQLVGAANGADVGGVRDDHLRRRSDVCRR